MTQDSDNEDIDEDGNMQRAIVASLREPEAHLAQRHDPAAAGPSSGHNQVRCHFENPSTLCLVKTCMAGHVSELLLL